MQSFFRQLTRLLTWLSLCVLLAGGMMLQAQEQTITDIASNTDELSLLTDALQAAELAETHRERMEALDGELSEAAEQKLEDEVLGLLKQRLRPEFLNRIDEIVMFRMLGKEQIRGIVGIQFERLQRLARRNHRLELELSEEAQDWLAERGFDPVFGARPLKRVLQREVANKLAEELLSGWIQDGEHVRIDVSEDRSGLVFETTRARAEMAEA